MTEEYTMAEGLEPYASYEGSSSSDCDYCEPDTEDRYGRHVHHYFVTRDGAASRTADNLARTFCEDVAALVKEYEVPEDLPYPDATEWADSLEDSEALQEECTYRAESALWGAGFRSYWNDGYSIERLEIRELEVEDASATWVRVAVDAGARNAVADALELEHYCEDAGCDISVASAHGYVYAAAASLESATEAPVLSAVLEHLGLELRGGRDSSSEAVRNDWEGFLEYHKEYGRRCHACNGFTYAEVRWEPERCACCGHKLTRAYLPAVLAHKREHPYSSTAHALRLEHYREKPARFLEDVERGIPFSVELERDGFTLRAKCDHDYDTTRSDWLGTFTDSSTDSAGRANPRNPRVWTVSTDSDGRNYWHQWDSSAYGYIELENGFDYASAYKWARDAGMSRSVADDYAREAERSSVDMLTDDAPVVVYIRATASRAGAVLGEASLWGIDLGSYEPYAQAWKDQEHYLSDTLEDVLEEALEFARDTLEQLRAVE